MDTCLLLQMNKLLEEISSSELTLTGWVKSNAKKTNRELSRFFRVANWQYSASYCSQADCVFSEVMLHWRFISIFKDYGSLSAFPYMYFLLPLHGFWEGCILFGFNNKAVFMRVFSPDLWKSCQTSHFSRLHFRLHSDLHTTLQTGSPFQLSEFGIGIGQQPKIAQDVCDTSRKQTDIMRNEMNTCWQSTYIHGC